jgi:hypothetical protein
MNYMDSLASWMEGNQIKTDTNQEKMEANIKTNWVEMKAHQERTKALMDANLEKMRACLGVKEPCPEKT